MTAAACAQQNGAKPSLVFFHSATSGRSRRVEGFVAQVLQRRSNHQTFQLIRVEAESHPDLVERFAIETIPTLVVVEDKRAHAWLANPQGCRDIEKFLGPWLR